MNNQVANTNNNTVDQGIQHGASRYSIEDRQRLRAIQDIGDASDADLDNLFSYADKTGLDPFNREIWLIGRRTKLSNSYRGGQEQWGTKWTIQIGIDGFRKATHRYAESCGKFVNISQPTFYNQKGEARPFWVKTQQEPYPTACAITVSVGESSATHVVTWDEYVQTTKSGEPNSQWRQYGPTQLSKCAEAGAHRRVAPITAGLYVPEELKRDDVVEGSVVETTEQSTNSPLTQNALESVTRALTRDTASNNPVDQHLNNNQVNQQQPAKEPVNVTQSVATGEDGYPLAVQTDDPDTDLSVAEMLEDIKKMGTYEELQKIHSEVLPQYNGTPHYDVILAAINVRNNEQRKEH